MKRFLLYSLLLFVIPACKKGGTSQTTPEQPSLPAVAKLAITDFSPKSAKPATEITITGTGFGSDVSKVQVAVGNSAYSPPISVTPTTIVFKTDDATPNGKISLIIGGEKVSSAGDFTALLKDLRVVGFQSLNGDLGSCQLGHFVYIAADGLVADTNQIFISFGGTKAVKASYLSVNRQKTGAIVPRYALAGKVTITIGTTSAISTDKLNLDMSMRDFTPKAVSTGDTMKITGVSFTDKENMGVYFDDYYHAAFTHPFKVTPTEMWVVVPTTARSGYLEISSTSPGPFFDISDDKFTLIPRLSFNNLYTPSSGKVGDVIRINGSFSGADLSAIDVSFGGSKLVKPTSINGPDIYVKIPADAKTGKITIARTGYAPFTGTFVFTVMP